jgi:UDP-N-acetylmuramyl pentapeptide phosphotransferase/UDP-N-acetylglucosamine-1-phosphate transferase
MPMAGLCINNLYGLFGIYEIPYWINAPLTVFVMVFIMNAINLIDGIDGLAASLSLMALGGFLIAFIREGLPVYCTLIAGLMGTLIPYLNYNLLGDSKKNRKIFMGDSGSLTLGFILSFLFVKFASYNPKVMEFHMDGLLIPYTLLIVPMLDVIRVILYRLRHHAPLFDADKNHIHHKLMRMGLTQHQTLAAILALALSFIIINGLIYGIVSPTLILLIDAVIYTLVNLFINYRTPL